MSQIQALEADAKRAIDKATDSSLEWLFERMKHYPPVRPSSRYIRTHNLQNSVEKRKRDYLSGEVVSTDRHTIRDYAHWVRDYRRQARVHQGRWPTDRDIAREAEQKIKGFYEGEIEKLK
jgi:hypothetical protein